MLVDLLLKLLSLSKPEKWDLEGRIYTSRTMTEVMPPLSQPLHLKTLTGLVDFYKLNIGEKPEPGPYVVHVQSHDCVSVVARSVDEWRRRSVLAVAQVPTDIAHFRFGQYLDAEEFIIGLQTLFEGGEGPLGVSDHYKVLRLVSTLAAEAVSISTDDGYSQTVATRQGVALKNEEKVSPRVELSPYRTFREITPQPSSEFVLRLRSRQAMTPTIALFEADGGEWRNAATIAIKEWLGEQLPGADIVA